VLKKISKVHNNDSVLQFIELSKCRLAGDTPALEDSLIERNYFGVCDEIVFIECKKFEFIVIPSSMIDFGTFSFPFGS